MNMPAPGFYAPAADRYAHMPYVRCGRSGLKLPRVSLGLWNNFGSVTPQDTARDMLLTAFDAGITYFDLANNYGPRPGAAEETLGKIMDSDLRSHRDELILSTKAGYTMQDGPYGDGGSRKYLMSSLDASLRRMKVDYVDIFYHHRFDPDTPLEETHADAGGHCASGQGALRRHQQLLRRADGAGGGLAGDLRRAADHSPAALQHA